MKVQFLLGVIHCVSQLDFQCYHRILADNAPNTNSANISLPSLLPTLSTAVQRSPACARTCGELLSSHCAAKKHWLKSFLFTVYILVSTKYMLGF